MHKTAKKTSPILVLAHGAGKDMSDPVLAGLAGALANAGVSCMRFNFPYKERGGSSPDPAGVLLETWKAAFETAKGLGAPVWVGGKSMGGRIASMAVAEGMAAAGLIFISYPLHPPGKTDRIRDAHLYQLRVPMLFIQGTRDNFARADLLTDVMRKLGKRATHHSIEGGDHSLRVSGSKTPPQELGKQVASVAAAFVLKHSD